jgi:hypothetical protein
MRKNDHETVSMDIMAPNGKTYQRDIDVEIAPLIKKLNDKGFYTQYCCSGHEEDEYHDMYIMFTSLEKEKLDILEKITGPIDDFYLEIIYRIDDVVSGNSVKLKDPTDDQLALAKILLKIDSEDVKIVTHKKPIFRYANYYTEYSHDLHQIEANHREVLDIFRQFGEALDQLGVDIDA